MSCPKSGLPLEVLESVEVAGNTGRTEETLMAHVHGLRCRECGREYDVAPIFTCEWCFGLPEVVNDYDAIRCGSGQVEDRCWSAVDGATPTCFVGPQPADFGATMPLVQSADSRSGTRPRRGVDQERHTVNPPRLHRHQGVVEALEFGFKVAAVHRQSSPPRPPPRRPRGPAQFAFIRRRPEQGKIVTTAAARRRHRRQLRCRQPSACGALPWALHQRERAHTTPRA